VHRTLRAWAYDTLKELIVTGELEPGQALVEAKLSSDLGISRSPIREALRQLGHDGLVITTPNSGTIVSPVNTFEIDQVFEVRDLLETCLVAHAALARTADELTACSRIVDEMPAAAANEEIRAYAALDVQFHQLIWDMAKRPRVVEVLVSVSDQARRFLNLSSRQLHSESAETLLASLTEHREILAAIDEGDVERSVAATRLHMSSSRRRILHNLERNGSNIDTGVGDQRRFAYTVIWAEGEF